MCSVHSENMIESLQRKLATYANTSDILLGTYNILHTYSGVPNRRTGLNKRTGWNISQKLINAQGLIIITL